MAYLTGDDLVARPSLLAQDLDGLEQASLDEFTTYQVGLVELEELTGLSFDPVLPVASEDEASTLHPRRVRAVRDVVW